MCQKLFLRGARWIPSVWESEVPAWLKHSLEISSLFLLPKTTLASCVINPEAASDSVKEEGKLSKAE